MGELGEPRWAVISERGREATGITYAEASRLKRRLAVEKLSGLCVVTESAARRLPDPQNKAGEKQNGSKGEKGKR